MGSKVVVMELHVILRRRRAHNVVLAHNTVVKAPV